MANQERDPRAYELMTVFIPDLTDEDSQTEIEKIEGLVTANGGTMTETLTTSPWGRRRLAYTIRFNGVDYRDGIYTLFHFDMAPSSLAELEREMKLDTNLMRYLLVHDDPKVGEKFRDDEDGESEGQDDAPAAEAGESAAAVSQAASTGETGTAETEATESAASDSAPAEETPAPEAAAEPEAPAAETSEPAAAAAAPVEEASAADTTTDTAPPAADEAASDDDKE